MSIPYKLVRSRRRTVGLQIDTDLTLTVRAPLHLPRSEIDRIVSEKTQWIQTHMEQLRRRRQTEPQPQAGDQEKCVALAHRMLPELVKKYAPLVGEYPVGITVTGAKARFGSCGSNRRLCFSWRLFLYPLPFIEYVVVHELCHLKHMNHSPAFWREVARVMPDYKERMRQ